MKTILLDAGQYQTKGKEWILEDGTTIHEGEFNRAIKARVMERPYNQGIVSHHSNKSYYSGVSKFSTFKPFLMIKAVI